MARSLIARMRFRLISRMPTIPSILMHKASPCSSFLYKGGKLSMVFLVPQSADAIEQLEQKLKYDDLQASGRQASRAARSHHHSQVQARNPLPAQQCAPLPGDGSRLQRSAQPNGAQFDGIVDSSDAAKRLFIGKVIHKTFVEVNEKGTEAAAATAIVMPTAAMAPRVQTKPFVPISAPISDSFS